MLCPPYWCYPPYCCTLKLWLLISLAKQAVYVYRDTDRSSRGQRQPRDRSFNPKDWEGVSAVPAPSARQPAQRQPVSPPPQRQPVSQPPKQQPVSQPAQQTPASQPLEQQADAKAAVPSKSPERTTAWWLGGNKPDAAGASPLDDGAGFDEWKPTGAGRKGWYNPHSSSSPGASKQDDPLQKPQSGTGDWGVHNEPIIASRGELISIACPLHSSLCVEDTAQGHVTHGMALGSSLCAVL